MLLICYPRCSTCRKAQKWLDEKGIGYDYRDIKVNNPTRDELAGWYAISGKPLRKFFNTSGMLYRDMGLKDKLGNMNDDEMLDLLATDGLLVKRPLVIADGNVLLGFREAEWEELLCRK